MSDPRFTEESEPLKWQQRLSPGAGNLLGAELHQPGGQTGQKGPLALKGARLQGDVRLAAWSQREQPEWAFVHSRWVCVFPGLTGKKGWREEMTAEREGP